MSLKDKVQISAIIAAFISYTYYVYTHNFFGIMWTLAFYIIINIVINLIDKDESNNSRE